jgi:hypothetical protein
MPFANIFHETEKCKEHQCKINNQNIKKIFKPDNGFIDTTIENNIFSSRPYKICDCIVVCQNDSLIIVEILCGKLTYTELKEKKEQLENCCKVAKNICSAEKIKKIVLLYNSLESPRKQPQLRKALLNTKICNLQLVHSKDSTFNVNC